MARDPSRPLKGKAEPYAFARACGYGIWESTRRASADPETGQGSKWEARVDVQARIRWWRTFGQSDEMLAEKKARLEDRLNMSAYGDLFQFAELVDELEWDTETRTMKASGRKTVMIDWAKVMASPLRATVSSFSFHKDTGKLTEFKRDDALQAANQLRDMHGFKSVNKTALTDPTGEKAAAPFIVEVVKFSDVAPAPDKASP